VTAETAETEAAPETAGAPAPEVAGTGSVWTRAQALLGPGRVPWLTVLILAAVMAYADGFWLTSLQGAVGAVERAQGPFATWLRNATIMVPVFVLAVLVGLAVARKRFGPSLTRAKPVLGAILIIVGAGSVTGVGEVAVSAAYDYHLQSQQIAYMDHLHTLGLGGAAAHPHPTGGGCIGTCAAQRSTLVVHARAVGYSTAILTLTNLVVVGWVVAMRGGQLDAVRSRRRRSVPIRA